MYIRVTDYETPQDRLSAAIESGLQDVWPMCSKLDGYLGVSYAVDFTTGRSLSIAYWDSQESLRQTDGATSSLRQSHADEGGQSILSVTEYKVVLNDFRSIHVDYK